MHSAEMVMETKLTLSKKAYFVIKRTFDIFASLIGIIVLLPLFLITIIAIKARFQREGYIYSRKNWLKRKII